MMKKLMHLLVALTLLAGVSAATIDSAEARRGGRVAAGVAAGIIGLGILGAYAASRDRADYGGCYKGRPRCEWVEGRCYYNDHGDRVCRRGFERCYRPTICD